MTAPTLPSHWVKHTKVLPASHPRKPGTVQDENPHLEIVVDDYQRHDTASQNAFTLVFTHGTSFSRVLWDLVIADLISRPTTKDLIQRVISIDAVNHGESGIRNKSKLGEEAFWPDISRDILNVLVELRVSGPTVGIGHSFGGGVLLHAALMSPSRFAATIFIEPILFQMAERTQLIAARALRRRDRWDSIDDVARSFSKGFADWDPVQLATYANRCTHFVKNGVPKPYWTLNTSKEQEAATYLAAPYPGILDELAQSSQTHYFIFGSDSQVINAQRRTRVQDLSPRPGSVSILDGAGHLIPMTHPETLGRILERHLVEIHATIGGTNSVSEPRYKL